MVESNENLGGQHDKNRSLSSDQADFFLLTECTSVSYAIIKLRLLRRNVKPFLSTCFTESLWIFPWVNQLKEVRKSEASLIFLKMAFLCLGCIEPIFSSLDGMDILASLELYFPSKERKLLISNHF